MPAFFYRTRWTMDGQCFALLIDADNVSAKYIKPILTELSKYGNITYKKEFMEIGRIRNIQAGRMSCLRTRSHRSSSSLIRRERIPQILR